MPRRVIARPNVHVRAFGDGLVLLDYARGDYFSLDATGAEIWRGIENGEEPDAIAAKLARVFEVEVEVALRDVVELFNQLVAAGLVSPEPS